jgi:hypothetical protein
MCYAVKDSIGLLILIKKKYWGFFLVGISF